VRLYLLRHGEVTSYRGDMPITRAAVERATSVGRLLGSREPGRVRVLTGETRRARETGLNVARGLGDSGTEVLGPDVVLALRNPDLYVNGVRVNMVSSAEALANQVEGLSAEEVGELDFFPEFFVSTDRVGWWLTHGSPPGEKADALASRIRSFAASLADRTSLFSDVVVAVTHSPLLRAVGLEQLGVDIGEPSWVSGLLLTVGANGDIAAETFEPEALA